MKEKLLWVLTVCSVMALTSCIVEDDPVSSPDNPVARPDTPMVSPDNSNALKQQLQGEWYDIYEATGTAKVKTWDKNGDELEKTVEYVHVMDVYTFLDNGAGSIRRFFYSDDTFQPLGMQITGFNYTSTQERQSVEGQDMGSGQVNITMADDDGKGFFPKTCSLFYDDDNITTTGIDGQKSVLLPASQELSKIINRLSGPEDNAAGAAAAAAGAGIIDLEGISTLNWHGLLYLLEPNMQAAIIGVYDYNIQDITVDSYRNMLHINIAKVYHINRVAIGAFRGLKHLRSINMADSGVQEIGPCAFKGCKSLVTATIPASCTVLGNEAYMNCTNLKTANMPGVNEMGESCFENCPSMTTVTLSREGLVTIPKRAFYGCRGLMSVEIPDCVVNIEDEAFRGCTGFSSLVIPKKVESIGAHAFEHCTSLITLTCLDSNVKFGKYAFKDCFELSTVTPYQFNTEIDDTVFEGCKKLIVKPKGN